jgi:3-polyprenyl-4-hydroxybenzoate decarboxylase
LPELLANLESVAEGVSEAAPAVEEALARLRAAGAIGLGAAPRSEQARVSGRLVLGVTGAIAAANEPLLIERLLRRGFEVRIAMTPAARRFVSPRALRALTHHRVYRSLDGRQASAPVAFLELAEWADIVVVAPASATTLARIAHGDCSELVSALAVSTRAPVVLAPSMNAAMLDSAPVARNLAQLVEDGFHVVHGANGLEVADAPEQRRPTFGSWPAVDDLVAVVEHVHQQSGRREVGPLRGAESATVWDALYRDTAPEVLPFHSPRLDDDLREVLETVARPATLWDVGTGLGTAAGDAAAMGFAVTATDLSSRAIAAASQHVPGVRFLVDDVRDSRVKGAFDVVLDRGCFHTLDVPDARRFVASVIAHTRAGSLLVLKLHRRDEPGAWRTARYELPDLERLWGPAVFRRTSNP